MSWNPFKPKENVMPGEEKPTIEGAPTEPVKEKTAAELIAESLAPFGKTLEAINNRLEAVETATKPKPPKVENPELASVHEDENLAFAQRLSPIAARQLELEARIVRDDIEKEYAAAGFSSLWNQCRNEITDTLSKSPLVNPDGSALRGSPDYIRNVVDMIFGRAARKQGVRFDGQKNSFFLEPAGGAGGHRTTPVDDGLTDKQRRIFERMGVSVADAKKSMGKLEFVH